MELNPFKTERTVKGIFLLVGKGRPDFGTEGIASLTDVPGAKRETVIDGGIHVRQLSKTARAMLRLLSHDWALWSHFYCIQELLPQK